MVVVLLHNRVNDTATANQCEDFAEAFDYLETVIRMARQLSASVDPTLIPRLRDQVLLNFARWLTDHQLSPAAEAVFIQLCDRKERSTDTTDVRLITAFTVADAMTSALTDPACWPDFDARFDELTNLFVGAEQE